MSGGVLFGRRLGRRPVVFEAELEIGVVVFASEGDPVPAFEFEGFLAGADLEDYIGALHEGTVEGGARRTGGSELLEGPSAEDPLTQLAMVSGDLPSANDNVVVGVAPHTNRRVCEGKSSSRLHVVEHVHGVAPKTLGHDADNGQ